MGVDVAPKNHPERESLIEGSIGELSPFHQTFGFYVDGVEIAGIRLPRGWEERLVVVENANTNGIRGLCLDPGDLAASKLVAQRPKDVEFVRVLLREQIVSGASLKARLSTVPGLAAEQRRTLERIVGLD
jgi:hypothetical protein